MEYVKSNRGGYYTREEYSDRADCVVLTYLEYKNLRQDLQEGQEYKKLVPKVAELTATNSTLEAEVQRLTSEVNRERELNRNLKRIALERANAKRGIPNKKQHDGYIVLSSQQYEERWTDEIEYTEWRRENPMKNQRDYARREFHSESVWKSVIQTPYDASIPYDTASTCIFDELLHKGVLLDLACNHYCNAKDNGIYYQTEDNENCIYKWTYSANYKLGFWEIIIYTTKQITVPEHRRPAQKIKK